MKTGTKVKLIAFFVIAAAIGGMVYAVSQTNFAISSIDDMDLNGGVLVVDFTLSAENPTIFPVYVSGGKYNLYIEDELVGEGIFGEVWMPNGNTTIACTQNIEDLTVGQLTALTSAVLGIGSVKISIEITELSFFFIKQEMSIKNDFYYSA